MRKFHALILFLAASFLTSSEALAQGLNIQVVNGYNLIVDSNVTTPATYAPRAAYIGAQFCNTGATPLTNVTANVGNYDAGRAVTVTRTSGSTTLTSAGAFVASDAGLRISGTGIPTGTTITSFISTSQVTISKPATSTGSASANLSAAAGIFPVKTFGADALRPHLANTGDYSLTLEVGSGTIEDATRYIGTLAPGECRIQYWLFSYPACVNQGTPRVPDQPPCAASITGGVGPEDDLSLDYDLWATADGPTTASTTRTFTLRNEISAAANKIWPNTDSKVPDEYISAIESQIGWGTIGPDGQPLSDTSTVYPGQRVITTQGIWYDLGNVVHGFDNNGDLIPDQNAWLQPVGDPGSFDSACFRMVNVYGIVIVKLKTGGELLIPMQNQLYHENLPDNTGVVGLVYYQYIATREGCSSSMTPYQEAASGFDNEKFAGDYGLNLGLTSGDFGPSLTFTKTDGVTSVAPGGTLTYTVNLENTTNTSTADPMNDNPGVALGAPDLGTPLVLRETIPSGTTYVHNSASAGLTAPTVGATGWYRQLYTDTAGNKDYCRIDYRVDSSSYIIFYSEDGGLTWSLTQPTAPAAGVTDLRWMLQTTVSLDGGHDRTNCITPNGLYDNGTVQTSLPGGTEISGNSTQTSVTFAVTVNSTAGAVICNTARVGFGPTQSNVDTQDCTLVTGPNTISGVIFEDDGGTGGTHGNAIIDNVTEVGIGSGNIVSLYYDANGDGELDSGDLLYGSTTTSATRSFSVGTTNTSTTLTSASFLATDVGTRIYGTGIPAGAYITAVVPGVSATISAPATATATVAATLTGGAYSFATVPDGNFLVIVKKYDGASVSVVTTSGSSTVTSAGLFSASDVGRSIAGPGIPVGATITAFGSANSVTISAPATATGTASVVIDRTDSTINAVNDFLVGRATDANTTSGWGNTTFDPNLALTTDSGILKLQEDLTTATLAISIDLDHSLGTDQSLVTTELRQINFAFAPPFQITKTVAAATVDEGDLFDYTITLENRLPSVGVQGPTGCQYTAWATSGTNGSPAGKEFANYLDALDGPNRQVASATVTGGGLKFMTGTGYRLASQAGTITRVEALFMGYFNIALTDDYLALEASYNGGAASGVTIPTAAIDTYIGPSATLNPNSAISWDITSIRAWSFADNFSLVSLYINPSKTANADAKVFSLDAIGIRVTTNADCEAGTSTTLNPVPLQDRYDSTTMTFVSAVPPPTTVTGSTLQWDNVGPIVPGTSNTVTVTMRALDVTGLVTGTCAATSAPSTPPPSGSACNLVETAYGGRNVYYADGRKANDDDDKVPVNIQGKGELRGIVYRDGDNDGWAIEAVGTDPRLPNVSVTLFACVESDGVLSTAVTNKTCAAQKAGNTWGVIATTTTDVNGAYEFLGLDTGTYIIQVGDTDSDASTAGSSPFGFTQTAEPLDTQTVTGSDANGADCGTCNSTWGSTAANLNTHNQVDGAAEETINGINFGYFSTLSVIYGNIWHDVNGDATRDAEDGDLDNFTVRLFTDPNGDGDPADGILVSTTTSNATGDYSFTVNVGVATNYTIVVTPETLPNNVWSETDESAAAGGNVLTPTDLDNRIRVTVTPGSLSGSHDFGYTLSSTSSIGDTVFLDFDGDGLQDATESGIPNVTVWLYSDLDRDGTIDAGVDTLLQTDVTDASGNYLFTGLAEGSYIVKVDKTDADFPTNTTATADPDIYSGTIGDRLWLDADGDAVQDAGENGLAGVTVLLWADDGNGVFSSSLDSLVAATVTNVNGNYLFTGLPAGTYFYQVDETTLPNSALVRTSADPTASSIILASNSSSVLTADAGYSPSSNFLLGDRVWHDTDGDHVQDAGEVGIGGVDITVTGTGCAPCTTTTNAAGFWYIPGLTTNTTYTVAVDTADLPRDFVATLSGTLTANRTNASPTLTAAVGVFSTSDIGRIVTGTGIPANTFITAVAADGSSATMSANATSTGTGFTVTRTGTWRIVTGDRDTADFGYRYTTPASSPTGTISGSVFLDADADRALDSGEAMASVTINLLNSDGYVIATTTTDSGGLYSFPGVFIGDYAVEALSSLGTRYSTVFLSSTSGFPNLNVIYDSTIYTTADDQSSVSVDGIHSNLLQDFGYKRFLGSVGDTVYWDANENGTQDVGEPGFGGVTVRLRDCTWTDTSGDGTFEDALDTTSCTLVSTTTTTADDPLTSADEGGKYLFSNLSDLATNHYYVIEVETSTLPGTFGTKGAGGVTTYLTADPETDGLVCTALTVSSEPPVAACESKNLVQVFRNGLNYLGGDFGYQITALPNYGKIGDYVWIDADGDGVRDSGEAGIDAITVWIDTDNDGVVDSRTASVGTTSGSTTVTSAGLFTSADVGRTITGTGIPAGAYITGFTSGNQVTISVAATATGTITASIVEKSTQTDSDGYYLFTGLPNGDYRVSVMTSDPQWPSALPTTPTFEIRTSNTTGLDNTAVVTIAGGVVTVINDGHAGNTDTCAVSGTCDLDVDFGYRYVGTKTLSGTVCVESATGGADFGNCGDTATDYSGVNTTGGAESALAGVTVSLYRWTDAGTANNAWNGTTGVLDAADTFVLLGSTSTDANGDYSFANVPDNVIVVFGVNPSQNLRLNTTNGITSVEGTGVLSRQLYNGYVDNDGDGVYDSTEPTSIVRQALFLGTTSPVVDLDFAFSNTLGGTLIKDFGDIPDAAGEGPPSTSEYNLTLAPAGASHMVDPPVSLSFSSGATTVTRGSGSFSSGDVGKPIVAAGIPAFTTITAVSGADATISRPTTAVGTSVSGRLGWFLGTTVTDEPDGFADPDAGVVDGGDVDEGVTLKKQGDGTTQLLIPGNYADGKGGIAEVTVSGEGWLLGWMDFDGDGNFDDAGERIIDRAVVRNNGAISVASLTRSGTTATVVVTGEHGLSTGQWVSIGGATSDPTLWNGTFSINVTALDTFEYTMSGTPGTASPTGTIVYATDLGLTQNIPFNVPTGATQIPYYFARFRFYPSEPLFKAPGGEALSGVGQLSAAVAALGFGRTVGEVEDYRFVATLSTTRVTVSSFSARDMGGSVAIEWETTSELGTVGFYLMRWNEEEGRYVQVNERLLPSLLTPHGGVYRAIDPGAIPGRTYRYELIEVEASGRRNTKGPYDVNTEATAQMDAAALRPQFIDPDPRATGFAMAARVGRNRSTPARLRNNRPAVGAKISVTEPGIHYVSLQELSAAGFSPDRTWLSSNKNVYALTNRGEVLPFTSSADNNGILFYGQALDSLFARDNVYWLGSSDRNSPRMKDRKDLPVGNPTGAEHFTRTLRLEQDFTPAPGLSSDAEGDYWFWDYVYAGDGAKTFTFRTDGATRNGVASIVVRLKGGSDTETNPDHHAVIRLNGRNVGEITWDGLADIEQTLDIAPSLLVDGENSFEVEGLADTGAAYSLIYLDSFEVRFESLYRAWGNRAEVSTGGNAAILVSGFTRNDLMVFDVTNPREPVRVTGSIVQPAGGGYGVALSPKAPNTVYHVVAGDALRAASRIDKDVASSLKTLGNRAEYVIVTGAAMVPTARTLADYRSDLSSMVVDIEDVYDEFNHGIPSPHALRAFLAHARGWAQAPKYVLLAGDGTWDYKNILGIGNGVIPPMMISTSTGLFPSDVWFANVDTSGPAPEMAIGRLPASTPEELAQLIEKIQVRESASGAWLNRALMASDDPDAAGDFPAGSSMIAGSLPAGSEVTSISLQELGAAEASTRLIDGINAGAGMVNYIGHGGYWVLADEGLFWSGDEERLVNSEQTPIMTAMTCMVGNFALPWVSSVGELLVRKEGGGVAALWAPTGASENELAVPLAEGYYRSANAGGARTRIGDAIQATMKEYEQRRSAGYMLGIYTLLGDPAMWIR